MLPFVCTCVNLLYAAITFSIAHSHTCCAIAYRHLHGWTSASCKFIFIVARCHLDGCKVSLGSSAPREECGGHEGWPWVLPSSAFSAVGGGSPAVPQPSFRDFVASRTYVEPLRLPAVPLSRRFGATSVDSIQGYCSG